MAPRQHEGTPLFRQRNNVEHHHRRNSSRNDPPASYDPPAAIVFDKSSTKHDNIYYHHEDDDPEDKQEKRHQRRRHRPRCHYYNQIMSSFYRRIYIWMRSYTRQQKKSTISLIATATVGLLIVFSWLVHSSGTTSIQKDGPPSDFIVHGKRDVYTPCPPQYRKRAWVEETYDTDVARAFRTNGWFVNNGLEEDLDETESFHVLYKQRNHGMASFSIGKPYQRFSRIPGASKFARKDTFFEGFKRLQQRYDKQQEFAHKNNGGDGKRHDDLMYFIPESYQLEDEQDQEAFGLTIQSDKERDQNRPWVLKKARLNNGEGIEMIPPDSPALYSAIERAKNDPSNEYIIQSYICNELTWFHGEKFDLRFYWMVASVDPLIVLYHDGYARVAGALYDETGFSSTGQHLTNHLFRGEVDEDVLADALWRRVREFYEANKARLSKIIVGNDPVRHVRSQIKEAISATAEAFKDILTLDGIDEDQVATENLFAFYGADFIIDADLDVYYVEAQTAPGIGSDYDYRINLFRSLFRPMVNIVEEIADKQEKDAKANLLPLESAEDWEVVYAGDWRYRYEGYERSRDKKGCMLSTK